MDGAFEQAKRSLASNIKRLRKEAGLSQEALALAADVDRTYVSQIEREVGNPSLLILCRLAGILNADIQSLLCHEHDVSRN